MQTIILRMDKQQGPMCKTWNYIQYPVIKHHGKVCMYVYIYIYTHTYIYIYIYN